MKNENKSADINLNVTDGDNQLHTANSNNDNEKNDENSKLNIENNEKIMIFKILLIVLMLFFISLFNNVNLKLFSDLVSCFNDKLFSITTGINLYLRDHPKFNDTIMIIGGLLEDSTVILGFLYFAFVFKSWNLLFSLGILYFFRGLVQHMYIMRIPADTTFRYPGFPSLFVPYLATNDYFFSGHVSLPTIVALNFFINEYYYFFAYSILSAIYQCFMMVVVRGHYSIDLYAGFIFSIYSFLLTQKLCSVIDYSNIGLLCKEEILYEDLMKKKHNNINELRIGSENDITDIKSDIQTSKNENKINKNIV